MDWSARAREAERAVEIGRCGDEWTIRRAGGGDVLRLSEFELRHLVRRVQAVLNAEDNAARRGGRDG